MNIILKRLSALRRTAQIASVFLLIYIIWNTRYPLSGFINPQFYFLIDPFVMFITSLAERVILPGLIYSVLIFTLTLVLGRFFCGWICPLGALLDFLSWCRSIIMKLFRKKSGESESSPLRYGKYAILSAVIAAAIFGIQLAWVLDPITIFVRTFSFNIHPLVNTAIDTTFTRLITAFNYPESLQSVYDTLREGILSLSIPQFPHTSIIFILFIIILVLSLVKKRFWCRYLCPLGATLALPAKTSLLRRDANACTNNCGTCKDICRMNAIRGDNSYIQEECILCMDCMDLCPGEKTTFSFKKFSQKKTTESGTMLSRSQFIALIGGIVISFFGIADPTQKKKPPRPGTISRIRPPGALPEDEFIQRCIRCGNCMKVCPTNVLQPSALASGAGRTWTPVMDPGRGYCEYSCALCGQVCPTEAIRKLTIRQKQKFVIGIASFDKSICLPYAKSENCIVCEEHCPIPEKAIRVKEAFINGKMLKIPFVIPDLCIGCAICENKCPTSPDKGIVVTRVKKV